MRFTQVDVFGDGPLLGNPLAVVHDADGLSWADMAAFARWTNLSETTFLMRPTLTEADYRVKIFTPAGELPFAGHPTLGSAHAWLAAGGRPAATDQVVQECAVGPVVVRRSDPLAFAAPPLVRDGDVPDTERARLAAGLGLAADALIDVRWCDNGPGWVGVLLADADAVAAVRPDWPLLRSDKVGLVGPHRDPVAAGAHVEVRALMGDVAVEDPVTGSLNASLAPWLHTLGVVPDSYIATQGAQVGCRGRVQLDLAEGVWWVGGRVQTVIEGDVDLG